MDALLHTHRQELIALVHQYGVDGLLVFGSMARGDAGPHSDVDLLIDNDTAKLSGFQLGAFQMDAQDILGRKVDLVTRNALHPMIRERILKEAVPIA
jgi:uncharacterized protein